MIITAILLILIALALVLSALFIGATVSFTWDGTTYYFFAEVVVLVSMLIGVLLVGFRRIESRVRAKQQVKEKTAETERLTAETERLNSEINALKALVKEKDLEIGRVKDELIRALKTPGPSSELVDQISQTLDRSILDEAQPAHSGTPAPPQPEPNAGSARPESPAETAGRENL